MALTKLATRATAIREMDPKHIRCRDYGHMWEDRTARWLPDERCYLVELECERCGTGRDRRVGPRGELMTNSYDYVEGYTLPPGEGRMTEAERDLIRMTSIQSLIDGAA